jgi:hypothetical protein
MINEWGICRKETVESFPMAPTVTALERLKEIATSSLGIVGLRTEV